MAKVTITFEDQPDESVLVSAAIEPVPQIGDPMPNSLFTAIRVRRFLDMDEKLHTLLCPDCGEASQMPPAKGQA